MSVTDCCRPARRREATRGGSDHSLENIVMESQGATTVTEEQVYDTLRNCYDPEIPVNIVDLGLIYDCHLEPMGSASYRVDVKMTLTAPGCGMGPMLAQDVQNKLLGLEAVDDVAVELVWDPPWNQAMMSEAAKLQLGLL